MTNKNKLVLICYILCAFLITTTISFSVISEDGPISQEPQMPITSALSTRTGYAIVIGVEDYPGTLYDLNYCEDDANSVYSQLLNNYGFDEIYIHLLLDSAATKDAITTAFNMISFIIDSNDVFFFYYSGHGVKGSFNNEIYPYDSISNSNNMISDVELNTYLGWLNSEEQYIIIDSCGSGGMIEEAQAVNRYFMTSSSKVEDSWETSALNHGVFTYYFLRSSSLATDSNGDGIRSMEEQFAYIYARTVSYSTNNLGKVQHPQLYDGITGETVIATTIGSLTFSPIGTQLGYSFFLYGHGTITMLLLTVIGAGENITVDTFDLTLGPPSSTGFGFYSDTVDIGGTDNVTGYQIQAVIYWPNNAPGSPQTIIHTLGDGDGDGLTDIFEIGQGLDPRVTDTDTDTDGLDDYTEYYGLTNPLLSDTDSDGMLDGYEVFNELNPLVDDSLLDFDEDGLNNLLESQYISMANDSDSDSDNMPDGWEYDNNLNLIINDAHQDPDNDTVDNLSEYQIGTDPHMEDTDGDTWNDGDEISLNTDPLDPTDYPRSDNASDNAIVGYPLFIIWVILLGGIILTISRKLKNRSD